MRGKREEGRGKRGTEAGFWAPPAAPGVPPLLREPAPPVWHLGPLEEAENGGPRVLIGGVGYWWQRDASFGLAATDALLHEEWPAGVRVAKLDYGAIYVSQDLLAVDPPYDRLVLIAATERGREPGTLHIDRWAGADAEPEEIQARIFEAGAGVVDLDHLLVIARHFGALPADTVLIELEPVDKAGGIGLSSEAAARLDELPELVRREALARPVGSNHD